MQLFEHGGNVYAAARAGGGAWSEYLDFSANINPLGLPLSVRQSLLKALDCVIHYPDPDASQFKQAVSRCYRIPAEMITAGNGAVELLYVLCHVIKPRRVLIPAPAFSEYERAARAAGAAIQYFFLRPEDGFAISTEKIAAELTSVDMVFIGNPNNPTGSLIENSRIEPLLAEAARRSAIVVVDESFLDFLPDDSLYTCRSLLQKYPNLFILHSLTKFYALPGLRLGFALSSPERTRLLHLSKDPWNVNCLAQAAGAVALSDADYRRQTHDLLSHEINRLFQQLTDVSGLRVYPPAVNFILIEITSAGITAAQLREAMLQRKILIRDCGNYPGLSPHYIRVAVKQPEQNQVLLSALQELFPK